MALFSYTTISLVIFFLFVSYSSFVNGDTTPQSVDCSPAVLTVMEKCMPFVSIGSQVNRPEAWCCIGVMDVMHTGCLCEWYNNIGSMNRLVNVTAAASLPYACKLVAPTMDSCALSIVPPSPPSPSPSPPTSPSPSLATASAPSHATASAPAPAAGAEIRLWSTSKFISKEP